MAACKRSVYLCATACESLPDNVVQQGADEGVPWSCGTGHLVTVTVEGRPSGTVPQEVLWVSAISCFAGSKPNRCHLRSPVDPFCFPVDRLSRNTGMLANTAHCQTEDQIYALDSGDSTFQKQMPTLPEESLGKVAGTRGTALVGARNRTYSEGMPQRSGRCTLCRSCCADGRSRSKASDAAACLRAVLGVRSPPCTLPALFELFGSNGIESARAHAPPSVPYRPPRCPSLLRI